MTTNLSQIPSQTFSREPNSEATSGKEGENENDTSSLGARERLKRLREEAARDEVAIPEKWGKEQMMKEWIEYTTFDAIFAPHRLIVAARDALVADAHLQVETDVVIIVQVFCALYDLSS
ncbi:Protein BIC2 [Senna tora]|uniref:Protein BIC2 n=1 Tax=Senna tora TaxID=362788 RepID=A0A834TJD4_9FABA|nr:Protein BIC2 [Senna tora]